MNTYMFCSSANRQPDAADVRGKRMSVEKLLTLPDCRIR